MSAIEIPNAKRMLLFLSKCSYETAEFGSFKIKNPSSASKVRVHISSTMDYFSGNCIFSMDKFKKPEEFKA
jgi:hypothetical protein